MEYLIMVRSVTYAYKAHRILRDNWIKSAVVRTPERYAQGGCGYSLKLRGSPEKAAALLEQAGIRVLRVIRLES
ncbi:MAG: DUF3343 domain-containing protein [Oscillospiraceae bacterium]|nr:DUF3343 domain-containing protein [Oscillospiraceae bacterium]